MGHGINYIYAIRDCANADAPLLSCPQNLQKHRLMLLVSVVNIISRILMIEHKSHEEEM